MEIMVDNFYEEYHINKMIEDAMKAMFADLEIEDNKEKYQAYVDVTDKILKFTQDEYKPEVQKIITRLLEVKKAEFDNDQSK